MKYTLLTLVLLFNLLMVHAQEQEPQKIDTTAFPLAKRLGFYPFSKAVQIMLIGYEKQEIKRDSNNWHNRGTAKEIYKNHKDYSYGIPKAHDSIDLSQIQEKKILNTAQIDTLTDILYNTYYRWTITELNRASCYTPHNGILFLNKNGKVMEYIEICFGCRRFGFSNKKIERFKEYNPMIDDLQDYFKKMGLTTEWKN